MEPNTKNSQGLTAQQMGQVAESNMKDRVLKESASNPGNIVKGAQMGALQTGTESTPVTFQAKTTIAPPETKPKPLTESVPGLKQSVDTGTISSTPADSYVKTLQEELQDKEKALRKQANESENAIFTPAKPEDQAILDYWEKGAGRENALNISPPGFADKVRQLKNEKIDPARAQMDEAQQQAAATSRVGRIMSGQEGTGYGNASFTRQQTQFKRQQDAFAIQERDLLQSAWDSALSGQVKQAEELRRQADDTAKQREQVKAEAAQAKKDALAIDKMTMENEKYGEDRVDQTVKRMVETGFEPNPTQLKYLDEKYGLPEGTSQTYHELAVINKEKADAKDNQERRDKSIEGATKMLTLLDKVPIGQSVVIDGIEYSGQSRGALKTGTETDADGNVTFWEYNQDTKEVETTSLGNIGKAVDGWETRDLGEQGLWRVNAMTGQYVPYGPTQSQKDWQKPFPEGSTSPFKDAAGNPRVQCGAFVNDLTGAGVGDTLQSKLDKCDKTIKLGSENPPRIGDFFVQSMNTWTGHIAMYAGEKTNPQTGERMVLALESNYPQPGKVTNSRWVNEKDILAFGRTGQIHPLLQSGPDSLLTSGSGTTGAAPGSPYAGVLGAGRGTKTNEDKILSPSEAKELGVPYGTTQSQAAAKNIIPGAPKSTEDINKLLSMPSFEEFRKVTPASSEEDLKNRYEETKVFRNSIKDVYGAIKRGKMTKEERAEFSTQAEDALRNEDYDQLEQLAEQVARKSMSVDQQAKYDSARNLVESYGVSKELLQSFSSDPTFRTGNVKSIIENAKKKGSFDADPRYTQLSQLLGTFQNEYRNSLFGASLTPGEMAEANKVIADIDEATPATLWDKLEQGSKIQSFVADARLADALGTKRPKLTDYLSN